jgi:hypothetical protein
VSTQIAEYSKTEAALSDLAQRYKGVVFPVETRDGMVTALKARAELRGYRVQLEKTRVELKAPALERSRLIDAEAKRINAELVALEDPIDEAIKTEETRKEREKVEREERERERVAAIQRRIADIGATPTLYVGKPSGDIDGALGILRDCDIGPDFAEHALAAAEAKGKAVAAMEQLLAGAIAQEREREESARKAAAEREELARLRREQEERERNDAYERAARDKADAEARAQLEAEQRAAKAKIAEDERAAREARDKADAEAMAKRIADDEASARLRAAESARLAEQERAAREAQAKIDADRREVQRLQSELLDGGAMLAKFVERFGGRKEFTAVVKAIRAYQQQAEAQEAASRG